MKLHNLFFKVIKSWKNKYFFHLDCSATLFAGVVCQLLNVIRGRYFFRKDTNKISTQV